jgi:sugar phosphate isomerase/epimerase
MSEYTISNLYQGGYSSLDPDMSYGNVFTGYRASMSELGAPTKPDTANQIQHVSQLLNQGIIPIEVSAIQPEIFETIPKQHFKEINRMAKLTGAKLSMHAPIIEASGIGERGWKEADRQIAEQRLFEVVEKASELDDKGGMPVTIHSASIPGTEYKMTPDGKVVQKLAIVNRETGAPEQFLEEEELYYPYEFNLTDEEIKKLNKGQISIEQIKEYKEIHKPISGGRMRTPQERLRSLNHTQWDTQLNNVLFNKERADEIMQNSFPQIQHLYGKNEKEIKNIISPEQIQAWKHTQNAEEYMEESKQQLDSLFHRAWKYGTEDERKYLKEVANEYTNVINKGGGNPLEKSQAVQVLLQGLKRVSPNMYIPVEEFALDKSSETFSNVAFKAFEKLGSKAPTISVENMYPGFAFSTGDEMNNLIMETKKKFVDKAIKKGHSQSTAEKQADKLIGITLDVGHLNMVRKGGFQEEDIRREVEAMAKHVKHVHLTDNFGFADTHLPPGMGNVPIKTILKELEKKDFKGRKIVEAGGFVQHFGISPLSVTLEAMGSPFYNSPNSPYWNQAPAFHEGYQSGYGMMLPQKHYQMLGAGFSQLPMELGGQTPGAGGSRMSGTPME